MLLIMLLDVEQKLDVVLYANHRLLKIDHVVDCMAVAEVVVPPKAMPMQLLMV
jgi:hypothetical protein